MVGVEDPFFAFEDVQRRTAELAAFQRRKKRLGIEKCTASRIDDEGAMPHLLDTLTIQEMVGVRVKWRMERDDIALLHQLVERHVLGGGLGTTVIGQYAAAKAP